MADQQLLRKGFLFESLNSDEIDKIAELVREKDVIAGDYVFDEGAQATSLFIVKYGTVQILKKSKSGDDQQITEFSSGSHFGEMAFLDRAPRAASVMTKENTKLLELPFEALDKLLERDTAIAMKIYRSMAVVLSRRIRQTTSDLSALKELKLKHL